MNPFTLQYAIPAPPEPTWSVPVTYDRARQLLVTADGTPAVADRALLTQTTATTSTAGSKVHFDD